MRIRLLALGTILGTVLAYVRWAKEIFDWLPTIDFLREPGKEPGWIGDVVRFITNPPGWVFFVILFGGLAFIWWDARRVQNKQAAEALTTGWAWSNEREKRDQVTRWLQSVFSDKGLRIRRAFLFGSILHDHYTTSDVDLVVLFDNLSDRRITKLVRRIKGKIRLDFQNTFSHLLHVAPTSKRR
jgi:hypothetical protein